MDGREQSPACKPAFRAIDPLNTPAGSEAPRASDERSKRGYAPAVRGGAPAGVGLGDQDAPEHEALVLGHHHLVVKQAPDVIGVDRLRALRTRDVHPARKTSIPFGHVRTPCSRQSAEVQGLGTHLRL